ncbi:MAG: hypothetical protein A4E62_01292 [Syntrophorhabdus sp. PtaU1.Bin002]|nr:MAG: hypothetical protein A4E62_01292 [Syntrophorhabdus sp. PtaU1.Bin002]
MKIGIETILGVVTGIGLSAACGFRIFVPLLIMNLAVLYGRLHLAPGFEWIGSHYATIAFGTATGLEVLAYYIPWLDNVLDAIASPVSVIAGTIVTASVITDMPPSMKWMVAIIAGGGIAGIIQGASTALRGKSSLFTGGLGNPLVSTLELTGAVFIALLAIIIPLICLILVVAFVIFSIYRAVRNHFQKMKVSRQ